MRPGGGVSCAGSLPWEVRRLSGTVRELHDRSTSLVPESGPTRGVPEAAAVARVVHVLEPLDRAVVLGSAQDQRIADRAACEAAGFDVVRRRSGGGAVLVERGQIVWVDLFIARGDPLWEDDVGQAAWWVGETWSLALGRGFSNLEVHKGPMLRRPWSSLVCFASLGPGEVTLPGAVKVVGVSQRRTRRGALFQSACLLQWDPGQLLSLLACSLDERVEAEKALEGAASGVGHALGTGALVELFISALPR